MRSSSNADLQCGERSVATWFLTPASIASPSILINQYDYVCRAGQVHAADVGEGTSKVSGPTQASSVNGVVNRRHFDL
jgi:hypothetical protein